MNKKSVWHMEALLRRTPDAWAVIEGSAAYPTVRGNTRFYQTAYGVIAVTEMSGLPREEEAVLAFHIHDGGACTGSAEEPFSDAGSHYNPYGRPHPYHAGDMPPLFSADGRAFSAFLTNRFMVGEIIGKTVILHAGVDDFTTDPSGNAGERIACGRIVSR